jgi:adenosyl cobinamide kinase/adenosyl cobinamide phosphate guanylyltransferase
MRNRIKAHRRVRAGDWVPHELNFRTHRLLAYELPDGRLKLLDGLLRRDLDSERDVEVEVPDVSEEDARLLLLSIDPLAALAQAAAGRDPRRGLV